MPLTDEQRTARLANLAEARKRQRRFPGMRTAARETRAVAVARAELRKAPAPKEVVPMSQDRKDGLKKFCVVCGADMMTKPRPKSEVTCSDACFRQFEKERIGAGTVIDGTGNIIGKNPENMSLADFASLGHHPRALLAVMREICVSCAGGEVAANRCCNLRCPQFPYRMGTIPTSMRRPK